MGTTNNKAAGITIKQIRVITIGDLFGKDYQLIEEAECFVDSDYSFGTNRGSLITVEEALDVLQTCDLNDFDDENDGRNVTEEVLERADARLSAAGISKQEYDVVYVDLENNPKL